MAPSTVPSSLNPKPCNPKPLRGFGVEALKGFGSKGATVEAQKLETQ